MFTDFDTKDLPKKVIDALDYIYDYLMKNYPNINFSIKKRMYNCNAVVIFVHDKDVFFTPQFQQWAFVDLQKEYLFPKNILNIILTFQQL